MNILCACNKNYIDKTQTMLVSLRKCVKEEIVVYFMNDKLTDEEIRLFRKYLKKHRIKLNVIDASHLFVGKDVYTGRWGVEMYFRVFAQFLLPEDIDRILWLDGDIIVKKDITDFYYQPFEEYYVVCRDMSWDFDFVQDLKHSLGLPDDHVYFNSGVLLINLKALRIGTDINTIFNTIDNLKEKFLFPDQDLLNCLYCGHVNYADENCNFMKMENNIENARIIHYAWKKPWESDKPEQNHKYRWQARLSEGYVSEWWKNWMSPKINRKLRTVKSKVFLFSRKVFIKIFGGKAYDKFKKLFRH